MGLLQPLWHLTVQSETKVVTEVYIKIGGYLFFRNAVLMYVESML